MDDQAYRSLERGLPDATSNDVCKHARDAERDGKPSLALWTLALVKDPANENAKEGYLGTGAYYPERIDDPILGPSIRHRNLPIDRQPVDIIVGDSLLDEPEYRTPQEWRTRLAQMPGVSLLNAKIEAAIKTNLFSVRKHPLFRETVSSYARQTYYNDAQVRLFGTITHGQDTQATLEEYTLSGTVAQRSINIPSFDRLNMILTPGYLERRLGPYPIILHDQQTEAEDGTIQPRRISHDQIDGELTPAQRPLALRFMEDLFGTNPAILIPALRYFTTQNGRHPPEPIKLSTHSLTVRSFQRESSLTIKGLEGLTINCGDARGRSGMTIGWRHAERVN